MTSTVATVFFLLASLQIVAQVSGAPAQRGGRPCDFEYCATNGTKARCFSPTGPGLRNISCGEFAKEAGCPIACPRCCLPEKQQPFDNTGKKYCTDCDLIHESCAVQYRITFAEDSPRGLGCGGGPL